jgi:tetratricopeptide (TPR) repeat protein
MIHRTVLLVLLQLVAAPDQPGESPQAIARQALAAVEGDSAKALAARWATRLQQHPADRAAALGLATLARLRYDYTGARRRYAALDQDPPDPFAVHARLGLATAFDAQGLQAQADSAFRRALAGARAIGDSTAQAMALMNLAYLVATLEGIESGMAYLDSARSVLPGRELELLTDLHRRHSVLLAVQSDTGATAEAETCARTAASLGARRLQADCLQAAALDLRIRGLADSSLLLLQRAAELQREARDQSRLAETLLREADILRGNAAFGRAHQVLDEALRNAAASHNLLALASAHTGAGSLALRVQDFATAGEELEQAVTLFRQQGDPAGAMLARSFLPTLHAAEGDVAGAAREADSIIAWYRGTGEVPNEFEMLRTRASIAMRAGDWGTAQTVLARAEGLASRHTMDDVSGSLELDRGRLALYRGALTEAERHLVRYVAGLDSSAHVSRHEARARLAEVYARQGRLDRAEQELALADDALDRWRATLADHDLRMLAFQAMPTEDYERHASAARVLSLLASAGHVRTAFALAERRRARALADQMAGAEAMRRGAAAPGLARRIHEQAGPAVVDDVIATVLDDSTALLEYVAGAGDAPSTAFIVTRAGVHANVLAPVASLDDDIARFDALLESGEPTGQLGRTLGTALLDSALASLPGAVTRLIIIPDGRLHHVPFDALVLRDGQPLIARYEVTVAPSAGVAVALRRRAPRDSAGPASASLLAFGDPAFAGEQRERESAPFRAAFSGQGALPRLAGSGDEAEDVGRYAAHAEVRLREDASEAFLKRADLSQYDVIHFATHALVDEARMDRTALALAPGDGEDGFVTPSELAGLRLAARLVVLSACETAGGKLVQGEGVAGLTAPLIAAGARAVVATKWRIGDESAGRMVDDFYSALADGHPVGAALRSAKLAAIRRNAPASEWAAFSVVGDPMVTVALTQPHDFAMVWIVVAMAGVLSLLVIVTKTLNHESTKDTKARMGRESSAKRSALGA